MTETFGVCVDALFWGDEDDVVVSASVDVGVATLSLLSSLVAGS